MQEIKQFKEMKKAIYRILKDGFTRMALRKAVSSFRKDRDKALSYFPHVEKEKKTLIRIKDEVISNFDAYIEKTIKSLRAQHIHAYYASNSDEAIEIIKRVVGTGKKIVKGKSITLEELDLNHYLENWGNEVYETDLGEFIVQLLKSRPMHILAPAVHVPKEKVAELFSTIAGKKLSTDPVELTEFARRYLRDKFITADVGITGANAITADTGSVFLIENEGNIRFATNAPDVHIVIAGIEKILPTFRDGTKLIEVVSRYAGYPVMSYVSIISGPSKTGDIEKTVVYGVHGPKELHVILLDNGRKEMAKDPIVKQALRCLRCGACMYECPVYPLTIGYWGYKYIGGIGIPWTAYTAGDFKHAAPMAFICTMCGRCIKYCPMSIDIPQIVRRIREILREKGYLPSFVEEMCKKIVKDKIPY